MQWNKEDEGGYIILVRVVTEKKRYLKIREPGVPFSKMSKEYGLGRLRVLCVIGEET